MVLRSSLRLQTGTFFYALYALILFSQACATTKNSSPVILVSLDGLGWQFTGGKFANTPNLDFVAKTGVKAKYLTTVTPTKTWPNHQTFMTGLYPESHGIVSNSFWDPLYEEVFIFDYDCSNGDPKFWNESEPIWVSLEKKGENTGMYFWPGFESYRTKPTHYENPVCLLNCSEIPPKELPKFRNTTRKTWPSYIHCFPNYSEPFRKRIDKIVSWLTSEDSPKFVGFYVDQPDWIGHDKGPESEKFKREIERVDSEVVGYLIEQLRHVELLDTVNLIFVADHSFVTVNKSRLIFLEDFIDSSTYRLLQSGAIGHIWPKPGQLDKIYQNLTTHLLNKFPQAKVYKKEDIPDEFHFKNNRRIPPIYVDPGLGWMVGQKSANLSENWVYGAHGYPASEKMGAIFYARGPAFKKGYNVDHALRSIDVYPLMCDILGMEPRPNNGSLGNMKDLMVKYATSGVGCVTVENTLCILISLAIFALLSCGM